jgi:hypothetical protein
MARVFTYLGTSKLITILVVFIPVLSMYGTSIDGSVSIFDIIIVWVIFLWIIKAFFHGKIHAMCSEEIFLLFLLVYIVIGLLIHSSTGLNEEILKKTGRLFIYLFFIIFVMRGVFSAYYGYKLLEILSFTVVFYLCIQYVTIILFDYYTPGFLSFIPVLRGELFTHSISSISDTAFRSRSILGEPSEIGLVVGLYLLITLLITAKYKVQVSLLNWRVIFASFGLMLSMSATGFSMLIISWYAWLFMKASYSKRSVKLIFYTLSAATLMLIFIFLIMYDIDISRINHRLGLKNDSNIVIWNSFNTINKLFGVGVVGREIFGTWAPSSVRVFYYFGIVGFSYYYLMYFLIGFFTLSKSSNILLFSFIILSFATQVGLSVWMIFFLAFIFSLSNIEREYEFNSNKRPNHAGINV